MVEGKADFIEAIREIEELHGNMALLSRLGPMLRDPNSDIADASRLIQSDGPLSATIIRISNSAYYRSGEKNKDVLSALRKVGFNQALRLVGIALSKEVFMRDLESYGISADAYWNYSYFSGIFMEVFGRRFGFDSDVAYLLGLLHGIGKVVINQLISEKKVEVYWDPSIPSEQWELAMIGFRYDRAGALLLKSWEFEEAISRRVDQQLEKSAIREDPMLQLLQFCRDIIDHNEWNFGGEEWELPKEHPVYQGRLGWQSNLVDDLSLVMNQVAEIRKTVYAIE